MDSSLIQLCRRFQSLAKLFRFVELFTLLILFSWLSTRLPFAVRISGEYFCRFAALLFSSTSVFVVGNVIVVTLLAKSGLFSADASSSSAAVDNVVAELCRKLRSDVSDGDESETEPTLFSDGGQAVVFQDKEVILCEEKVSVAVDNVTDEKNEKYFPAVENKVLSYRRTKSEKFNGDESEKETEKLRRSETDICRRHKSKAEVTAEEEGDGGGSEEFRRTIEEFIAKQVRFHREESLAVVIHGQA